MREKVIQYIPKLVYAKPEQGLENTKDAFDSMSSLLAFYKESRSKSSLDSSGNDDLHFCSVRIIYIYGDSFLCFCRGGHDYSFPDIVLS
ncbi:hypothetical protein V6N12_005247 [Hibiscus sabdariffa]|uniref:Uncharacterized protein n=1 Tax=Hibiscus sabdariffa TaxID=183260 RepID=A0ABR2CNW3_9ROSI